MNTRGSRKKQEGAIAVMVAFFIVVLLAIGAVAIDVGNLIALRNEAQNAADATALAAASCLYHRTECANLPDPDPTFDSAAASAVQFVSSNKIQNVSLIDVGTKYGYWDITNPSAGLQPSNITPGPTDAPAIKVTIHKDGSDRNGTALSYIMNIFGINILKVNATATAILSSPGTVGQGALFPMAISQCMYQTYWNTQANPPQPANSPALATSDPGPQGPIVIQGNGNGNNQVDHQVIGTPWKFMIGSSYHAGPCDSGQWTEFNLQNTNANALDQLISGTTLAPSQSIGDTINIETGTVNSGFNDTANCLQAGGCQWVTVPVVTSLTPNTSQAIVGFACLHILNAINGSNPFLEMQMSNNPGMCQPAGGNGVGPNYGSNAPPRLVQ
jgi:Flp pilus assembly protein TadG